MREAEKHKLRSICEPPCSDALVGGAKNAPGSLVPRPHPAALGTRQEIRGQNHTRAPMGGQGPPVFQPTIYIKWAWPPKFPATLRAPY